MSDKEQMKLFDLLNLISDSPESRRCLEQTIYQRKRCPYCHIISDHYEPLLRLSHRRSFDPVKDFEHEDFNVWINRNLLHIAGDLGNAKTHIKFCPMCGRNLQVESLKRKK